MALEGALENELLSHTECFVDRKTDQQRRVGLKIRMGVGGRLGMVEVFNWLADFQSRNGTRQPANSGA